MIQVRTPKLAHSDRSESDLAEKAFRAYSIKVRDGIHSQIDRHISLCKVLRKGSVTKQEWILDAIREKLDKEHSPHTESEGWKTIYMKIDLELHNRLEHRIEEIKKVCVGFSRKEWIMEAVQEKMDSQKEDRAEALSILSSEV